MKKTATAALLCLAMTAASVQAQTLQPQMSAQDIRNQTTVEAGHVIVPILFMLFLLFSASRSSGPQQVFLVPS